MELSIRCASCRAASASATVSSSSPPAVTRRRTFSKWIPPSSRPRRPTRSASIRRATPGPAIPSVSNRPRCWLITRWWFCGATQTRVKITDAVLYLHPTSRLIDWLIWSIDWLIDLIDWSIDCSIDWLIDRSIDWSIDWLIWSIDRLIDWLIWYYSSDVCGLDHWCGPSYHGFLWSVCRMADERLAFVVGAVW